MFIFKLRSTIEINGSICFPNGEEIKKKQNFLSYYRCCRDSRSNS